MCLKPSQFPSGSVDSIYTARREAPFFGQETILTLSKSHYYGDLFFLENGLYPDAMGWGRTGYQKCPSNFFILCGYIDYVYMNMYTCSQFVTNFVMGLKI